MVGWLVGWLIGWLVGNAIFSETALRIFLIVCMKLGDYKGRKVTEADFWKEFLIWRYTSKRLQISPKSETLILFSKLALTMFLVFGQNLVLNMTQIRKILTQSQLLFVYWQVQNKLLIEETQKKFDSPLPAIQSTFNNVQIGISF